MFCVLFYLYRTDDQGWAPRNSEPARSDVSEDGNEEEIQDIGRKNIEQKLQQKIFVDHFGGRAGETIQGKKAEEYGYTAYTQSNNIYASFVSRIDWEFAKWAKQRKLGSNAVTELLSIKEVSNL